MKLKLLIILAALFVFACGGDEDECTSSKDCKDSAKPVCNETTKKCEAAQSTDECTSNADCKDSAKPVCNETTKKCEAAQSTGTKTIKEVRAMDSGTAKVENLVVTAKDVSSKGNLKGVYVQNSGEGLYVHFQQALKAGDDFNKLEIGNVITVEGEVKERENFKQLEIKVDSNNKITSGSIVKTGTEDVPAPLVGILPLEESQESVIVKLDGTFTVTELGNTGNSWNTTLTYGVDAKRLVMRSSLYRFTDDATITTGTIFSSITGIITQFEDTYSIQPRNKDDLVVGTPE